MTEIGFKQSFKRLFDLNLLSDFTLLQQIWLKCVWIILNRLILIKKVKNPSKMFKINWKWSKSINQRVDWFHHFGLFNHHYCRRFWSLNCILINNMSTLVKNWSNYSHLIKKMVKNNWILSSFNREALKL